MKVKRKTYKGARFMTAKEVGEIVAAGQAKAEFAFLAGHFVGVNRRQYRYPDLTTLDEEKMAEYVENVLDIVDETLYVMDMGGGYANLTSYYDIWTRDFFTPPDDVEEKRMWASGAINRLYLQSDYSKMILERTRKRLEEEREKNRNKVEDSDGLPF